jgi:membrane protease subunit HflK
VVRTFGKETARTEPGLNYRYPWPFQRVDIVSVEQIRRIEVGFRGSQRVAEEALMLTGDENIVEAQIVVQYRVADPSKTSSACASRKSRSARPPRWRCAARRQHDHRPGHD